MSPRTLMEFGLFSILPVFFLYYICFYRQNVFFFKIFRKKNPILLCILISSYLPYF